MWMSKFEYCIVMSIVMNDSYEISLNESVDGLMMNETKLLLTGEL